MASSSHSIGLVAASKTVRLLELYDRLGKQLRRDVAGLSAYYYPLSVRNHAEMQPPDRDGGWQKQVSSKAGVVGHVGEGAQSVQLQQPRSWTWTVASTPR